MADYWWFLLETNAVLLLLWGLFKSVKRQLSYTQQRFTLLALPVLAVATPLLRQLLFSAVVYEIPVIRLKAVTIGTQPLETGTSTAWFSWELVYGAGVMVCAALLLYRLLRIWWLFRSQHSQKEKQYRITELPGHESFSFFNYIQLRTGLSPEDRAMVLEHEQLHADRKHSLDLLFIETIRCFGWFNPIFFLLRKELMVLHEFEVDQLMYRRHQTAYMEFLLAYALGTSSSSYLLTQQLSDQRMLIKRMNIMKHEPKKKWAVALLLPVTAGALTLVSWTFREVSHPEKQPVAAQRTAETDVDKQPEFNGGMEALTQYMLETIRYPEKAQKAGVTGTVYTEFLVTGNGKVKDVIVKRGVSPELDAEAVRVIKDMPDWIPAEKNGKKVDAKMILPVAFKL